MELRKFARYPSENLIDYTPLDHKGNMQPWELSKTLDISLDGLQIETRSPLKNNTLLHMIMSLNDHLIHIEGVTIYCNRKERKYVAGLSFQKIPSPERRKLQSYLEELA